MSFETGGNFIASKLGETKIFDLPQDINLPEDTEITPKLIEQLIRIGQGREARYEMLQDYYEGRAVIQERIKESHKANNKIVSAYPSYIVDVIQGYFIGKPVQYSVSEEEQKDMDHISRILEYNDEADENSELSKICGIKGRAYELIFVEENGHIRFNELQPDNIVYVYDDKIVPEPLFAVRYYYEKNIQDLSHEGTLIAKVYTRDSEITFRDTESGLIEESSYPHYFDRVPMIEYKNNDEGIGDFERVISIIDAYNKINSDTANDFEEFTDAFLYLHNMLGTTVEEAMKLNQNKIILGGEGQDAKWLIKDMNSTAIEDFKNRLDSDIHKFSKVPNMSDEQFAGNSSGESMKYKLLPLDQLVISKQRKFKRALQERLELITNLTNIRNETRLKHIDIDIIFTTNKPINEKEMVELANNLRGLTSDITALSKVAAVTGVSANEEKQRLDEEIDPYLSYIDDSKIANEEVIDDEEDTE